MPGEGRRFEVGNPGGPGRPRKGDSFKELYEREMEAMKVEVRGKNKKGVPEVINAKLAMVRARIRRAVEGDRQDQDAIENRVDGKPAETIQHEGIVPINIGWTPMTEEEILAAGTVKLVKGKLQEENGSDSESAGTPRT